jgi:hypothetical protein
MIKESIERIQTHENTRIQPGEPYRIPDAASVGDGVPQGDLYIMLAGEIPDGCKLVESPTDLDRQLVPGNTTGSKHCLRSLSTVDLYWPEGWSHSLDYEGLAGPAMICKEATTIDHPTHGAVTIPAGSTVVTGYQRVYDEELKRERRAAD